MNPAPEIDLPNATGLPPQADAAAPAPRGPWARTASPGAGGAWINRFAALGPPIARPWRPDGIGAAQWVATSDAAAALLGWQADWPQREGALEVFSGHALWPGMEPVVGVYSGHQFGFWAGQLGDGRALLLGEAAGPHGTWEVQLKGAGLTPYSRMGDGRAVLRSSIREFLCSEAMHALGIPTTRALCLTASSMPVARETLETAAVVTRLAPSFVRFGHFEHFGFADHREALQTLVDHVVSSHLPQLEDAPDKALALLDHAVASTAALVAAWQGVGFCHGVLNTDNMSILGLTIDYGPFGFLDAFDPGHICNHSDDGGRYAYQNQPQVGWWNLQMLGRALAPLVTDAEAAKAVLQGYRQHYGRAMLEGWRRKFGFTSMAGEAPGLVDDALRLLAQDKVDFTIFFRRLCRFDSTEGARNDALRDLFLDRDAFDAWAARYAALLRQQGRADADRALEMLQANPKFVLRNHLAETAIRQAQAGDFSEVLRLHRVLQRPYDEQAGNEADAGFPPDWAAGLSVSCSS